MTTIEQNNTQGLFLAHLGDPGRPCYLYPSARLQIGSDSAGLDVVDLRDRESMRFVGDRMVCDAEAL